MFKQNANSLSLLTENKSKSNSPNPKTKNQGDCRSGGLPRFPSLSQTNRSHRQLPQSILSFRSFFFFFLKFGYASLNFWFFIIEKFIFCGMRYGIRSKVPAKLTKATKPPSQKNDTATVAASEKKGVDRPPEKDRNKDGPHPRMQYDDKSRVEKARRCAVLKQTEARNKVELLRHLPQYEHGTLLPDLEPKFFQLDPVYPVVNKVLI